MPTISKTDIKTRTVNGEITINLNLKIGVDVNGDLGVSASVKAAPTNDDLKKAGKGHMEVPEEMFDEIPTLPNFGQAKKGE